jgi:hypothetical protein
MKHQELVEALSNAGFNTGWAVRDGIIILWANEEPIPDNFAEYVKLDEAENDN